MSVCVCVRGGLGKVVEGEGRGKRVGGTVKE